MSLFKYDYTCPKCGRKDIDLEEGDRNETLLRYGQERHKETVTKW